MEKIVGIGSRRKGFTVLLPEFLVRQPEDSDHRLFLRTGMAQRSTNTISEAFSRLLQGSR